ncbi:hypothetical protein [Poriferisphaera sp. WC338]|uniref:hypothetical protein n=1 Tax=Poriferisphaera sp. WC338 TaxID=3425129 RepID=UPI003D81B1B4
MFQIKRRNYYTILSAALGVLVCFGQQANAANIATGFINPNVFFDNGSANWTFNSPWFYDSGQTAATFQTSATNAVGFYALEGSPRDLTAESNVLALDNYNPATTKLTSLTFSDPFRLFNFGTIPADGEYNFFIEFTIETFSGFYRASTQKVNNPFENTTSQLGLVFDWETGGFLGDPFVGGNGIALGEIIGSTYNAIFEVVTPTTGGNGFFGIEGFNLAYEVTSSIPEPASIALIGFGFVVMCQRHNHKY